jgi:hypothetical protein
VSTIDSICHKLSCIRKQISANAKVLRIFCRNVLKGMYLWRVPISMSFIKERFNQLKQFRLLLQPSSISLIFSVNSFSIKHIWSKFISQIASSRNYSGGNCFNYTNFDLNLTSQNPSVISLRKVKIQIRNIRMSWKN